MKAVLLAAGNGTRLRPLTDTVPKCLLPIRGVPILGIWLDACRRAGIEEVLVNTHAHANMVWSTLAKLKDGIHVTMTYEPTLLGSAGTLRRNRHWLAADPDFWVFYGDVLTNADLSQMLAFHRHSDLIATLGVYQVADPTRCGVLTFDDEHVVREFVEKPADPKSNWAFSGIMLATSRLLDAIPSRIPSDLGFDVLPKLAGSVAAYPISEFLLDIGTFTNYQRAQQEWPGLRRTDKNL